LFENKNNICNTAAHITSSGVGQAVFQLRARLAGWLAHPSLTIHRQETPTANDLVRCYVRTNGKQVHVLACAAEAVVEKHQHATQNHAMIIDFA
jgi:hypothetical protein